MYLAKVVAFLTKMIYKIATDQKLDSNELQSLNNIMDDMDADDLDEMEFRY